MASSTVMKANNIAMISFSATAEPILAERSQFDNLFCTAYSSKHQPQVLAPGILPYIELALVQNLLGKIGNTPYVLDLLGSGRLPRPVCVRDLQVTVIYPLISLRLSVCIFDICDESVLNNQTITNLNVWNVLKKTLPPFQGCTGWVLINLAMDSRNTLALPSVYDLVSLTLDDWEYATGGEPEKKTRYQEL
uniref:Uncharacterized protein n=1 Tax=Physcomitrium patens TaxID=3218 RepID=A0A2K1JVX8_PHYPA|nr:hypothetical protein PHYPA_015456 [Physcomitrium patens]